MNDSKSAPWILKIQTLIFENPRPRIRTLVLRIRPLDFENPDPGFWWFSFIFPTKLTKSALWIFAKIRPLDFENPTLTF